MRFSRPVITICAAVALLTALQSATVFAAQDVKENEPPPTLVIVKEGDLALNCSELSHEALKMQGIVNNTQDIQNDSAMQERGISVAGAAAGLLVGTVTGGIGIAAAGMLAKHAADVKAEDAESLQDIAFQRRTFMLGIFKAKRCFGPIEHTLLMPEGLKTPLEALSRMETAAGDDVPQAPDMPKTAGTMPVAVTPAEPQSAAAKSYAPTRYNN
ncbi:MAG: hypothetical protein LRY76_03875 [Alphaproteobacteria bacterium]|nr:hypothetical protein [Alphaproteobacteria bacterium]